MEVGSRKLEKVEEMLKCAASFPSLPVENGDRMQQYLFPKRRQSHLSGEGVCLEGLELLCDLRETLAFSGLSSAHGSQGAVLVFIDHV